MSKALFMHNQFASVVVGFAVNSRVHGIESCRDLTVDYQESVKITLN